MGSLLDLEVDQLCPILIIINDNNEISPLPLKYMEYHVNISDFFATVELR